jgi:hypothetical protein
MATRSRRSSPPPVSRNQLILPGALVVIAIIVAIVGYFGIGTGILLGAVGAWLVVVGRHRRWKGAPEAGYLLAGVGLLIIILALFS